MPHAHVLLVANRTAADAPLVEAVQRRALRAPARFHLLVPATPAGLHRVVDPEVAGRELATRRLERAIPILSQAAGHTISGHVGDSDPLCAIHDALTLRGGFDEVIISTLPWRISRWLHVDLPSKIRALGVPVLHVQGTDAVTDAASPLRRPAPPTASVARAVTR